MLRASWMAGTSPAMTKTGNAGARALQPFPPSCPDLFRASPAAPALVISTGASRQGGGAEKPRAAFLRHHEVSPLRRATGAAPVEMTRGAASAAPPSRRRARPAMTGDVARVVDGRNESGHDDAGARRPRSSPSCPDLFRASPAAPALVISTGASRQGGGAEKPRAAFLRHREVSPLRRATGAAPVEMTRGAASAAPPSRGRGWQGPAPPARARRPPSLNRR